MVCETFVPIFQYVQLCLTVKKEVYFSLWVEINKAVIYSAVKDFFKRYEKSAKS